MIKIALTGGIGCGKSTVCEFFSQYKIPIIDTDIISRELVEPGQAALSEITETFGADILLPDGSLNRKSLAEKIFNNDKNKHQLETILHPKIRQAVQTQLNPLNACYAIIAIPLLVETKQQNNYDRVLLVDCEEQQQVERTLSRDQRNLNEVQSILKSQASREQRIAVADDVIDNSGTLNALKEQIEQLHTKYLQLC